MVKILHNFNEGNLKIEPLDVKPEKVQKYLDKGWVLAEGEVMPKLKKPKGGKTLEVDPSIVPGATPPSTPIDPSNPSSGDDGKPIPPGGVVSTPTPTPGNTTTPAPTGELPSLTGKTKPVLLGIAKDEDIEVDEDLAKPEIVKIIEAARAERAAE